MGIVKLREHDEFHIMNTKIVLAFFFTCANAGRIFILDDGVDEEPMLRVRRDAPGYAPPVHAAPAYHAPKGRVGPVYTFVKTDPQANFKWGVRHRAGLQYGR